MFHYSLRVINELIDELKMSEIRILNLCHKKSILVDVYRQSLLINIIIIITIIVIIIIIIIIIII